MESWKAVKPKFQIPIPYSIENVTQDPLEKTKQRKTRRRLTLPYIKTSYLVRVPEIVVIDTSKDKHISALE